MPRSISRNPRVRSPRRTAADVRLAHKRDLERALRQERQIQRLQKRLARAMHTSDTGLLDLRRALGKRFEFADLVRDAEPTPAKPDELAFAGVRT